MKRKKHFTQALMAMLLPFIFAGTVYAQQTTSANSSSHVTVTIDNKTTHGFMKSSFYIKYEVLKNNKTATGTLGPSPYSYAVIIKDVAVGAKIRLKIYKGSLSQKSKRIEKTVPDTGDKQKLVCTGSTVSKTKCSWK